MTATTGFAQPGDLDTSFDPGAGAQKMPVIRGLYVESASSFIVYGNFDTLGGVSYSSIARIGATGAPNGNFSPPDIIGEVRDVQKLSGGDLVVGGDFRVGSGTRYYDLAFLNDNGSLDTSYWSSFDGQGAFNALAVQSDDYVVCGGQGVELAVGGTNPTRHLVRVDTSGYVDGTYPEFYGPRAYVLDLHVETEDQQNLDQLTVNGAFNEGATTQIYWLGYLDSSGGVVAGQEDNASNDGPIIKRLTTSDSKTFVVGNFTVAYGNAANRIMRLNANGSLDTSFAMTSGPNGDVTDAVILSDDSLVIVGAFTRVNGQVCNGIARLLPSGAVDTTFAGSGANAPILGIGGIGSSSLYLVGAFTTFDGQARKGLAAIDDSGSLLTTFSNFNPGLATEEVGVVHDLVKDSSGRYVVGGEFNWFGGVYSPNLVRLESDGSVDTSFYAGLGTDGTVYDVALASDGSVYAAGDFPGAATRPLGGVARFDSSGAVDMDFTPIVTRNDNSPPPLYAVLPESGGTVLVGGHVRKVDGQAREPLARLDADGRLDATFDPQLTITNGTSLSARTIVASGSDYYVGGYVTYEGLARGFFTRLTATGAMDTDFAPTSPSANVVIVSGTVLEAAVQSDGMPVFCGEFQEVIDGSFFRPQRQGLARFSATGALDEELDTSIGAQTLTYVDSLYLERKGQVLIAGDFTAYDNEPIARVARIKGDGNLDADFDPGTGVPDRARVIRRVGPRMGLVGGEFLTYDGVSRPGLAAFELDVQTSSGTGPLLLLLK